MVEPILGNGRMALRGMLAACLVGMVAGCGDGDMAPVTAASSKYQVAKDDDKGTAESGTSSRDSSASSRTADSADSDPSDGYPAKPSSQPPRDFTEGSAKSKVSGGSTSDTSAGAASQKGSKSSPSKASPAKANTTKTGPNKAEPDSTPDPTRLPDGTPEELLAYLDQLMAVKPRVRNEQEFMTEMRKRIEIKIRVAEKILASESTPDDRLTAARHKVTALLETTQLGGEGAEQELIQWCGVLATDKVPKVAQYGRSIRFQLNLGKVKRDEPESAATALTDLKELLSAEDADEEVFRAAQTIMVVLQEQGFTDELPQACNLIGERFKDHKSPQLAAASQQVFELARTFELDVGGKIDAVRDGKPDAEPALLTAVEQLLEGKPSRGLLEMMTQAGRTLEQSQKYQVAGSILDNVEKSFSGGDPALAGIAAKLVGNARRRLELIGKPLVIEGILADKSPFDWQAYKGKVVLVHFWAAESEDCMKDLRNEVGAVWDRFRQQDFAVVTVNLDKSRRILDQFLAQRFPWPIVVGVDPKTTGFDNPTAVECGVDVIPFIVLVDRDGKVAELQTRGETLDLRIAALLGGKDPPPPRTPATPAGKPRDTTGKKSSYMPSRSAQGKGFVTSDEPAAAKPSSGTRPPDARGPAPSKAAPPADATETSADDNPYSPRADMTAAELGEFILSMQDKPKSIQDRPGFSAAIVEAADRILANPNPVPDKVQILAVIAKLNVLHKQACNGDEKADQSLTAFVVDRKDDARPRVASMVKLLQLERRVLDSDNQPVDTLPNLLAELKSYFEREKLDARHLRMASSTVRVINRLVDADQREQHFVDFGKLFAKADDKELARYGKKLAKPPATKESDLVGKPLELRGTTASGADFDWSSYRGKVVLVDFWATWCGPCVREIPQVKAVHEKFRARGFEVVGVSLDKDLDALQDFLARTALPWTTLAGEDTQELATKYGVRGIPTMMLVDRTGTIVAVSHSSGTLEAEIEKLLAAK